MKVLALLLVAFAVANANFLQSAEDEVFSVFEQLKVEGTDSIDDALEEMKGLLVLIQKCADDDQCRETVHSVVDGLINDFQGSEEKRAVTATAIAAAKACLASAKCRGAAPTAAKAVIKHVNKPLWSVCIGKRAVTATAIAAAKACLASATCRGAARTAAEAVVKGVKGLWNKIFGKRVVTTTALSKCCVRENGRINHPKPTASVKDLWKKIFGKRAVVGENTKIADAKECFSSDICRRVIAPTQNLNSAVFCLANSNCPEGAKAISRATLNGFHKMWLRASGSSLAAAKSCMASKTCQGFTRKVSSALISQFGHSTHLTG